jgi:hypothetical protein
MQGRSEEVKADRKKVVAVIESVCNAEFSHCHSQPSSHETAMVTTLAAEHPRAMSCEVVAPCRMQFNGEFQSVPSLNKFEWLEAGSEW